MERKLPWYTHLAINSFWLGINTAAGSVPILIPFLIVLFMPPAYKNTYLATLRVIGLALAMLTQPIAGYLSDRSTSRWGRRRPFIFTGAVFSIVFVAVIGSSAMLVNSPLDTFFQGAFAVSTAFAVLFTGYVLLQVSSNLGQAALQGFIPDIVPLSQRGFSSGVKSTFEVLPILPLIIIGPLVGSGKIWAAVGIMIAMFLVTMAITMIGVKETPNTEKPGGGLREPILRSAALMIIFVVVSQAAVWLIQFCVERLAQAGALPSVQVAVFGLVGLVCMAGTIFVGVYSGARVGIGNAARQQGPFIWWVINRLLFLAAATGVRDFAQNFLRDVLNIQDAAKFSSYLIAVIGVFLVLSALVGGSLSDRVGRKRTIAIAGLVTGTGAILILFVRSLALVYVAGVIIGLGTGLFLASNWALGTSLVPPKLAGKYLGISNLAGAGAGIVATGIGGPMIDSINMLTPTLGYLVVIAIFAALFFVSSVVLALVKIPYHAQVQEKMAPDYAP